MSSKQAEMPIFFKEEQASAIRRASMAIRQRLLEGEALKVADGSIGNLERSMHPAVLHRFLNPAMNKEFAKGIVKYSSSIGEEETNRAFLNIIASSGFSTEGLYSQITSGGSQAMVLSLLGTCGYFSDGSDRPLLMFGPVYTNYPSFLRRMGLPGVAMNRTLDANGKFNFPSYQAIEDKVIQSNASSMLLISYDNPTGQLYTREQMIELCKICVRHGLWIISDEAYRELYYVGEKPISIWDITEEDVPGITGRRISIESASKVWKICGFRIGALVTDNPEFHRQAVAVSTAELCPPTNNQWYFGALAEESHDALNAYYEEERAYYRSMLFPFAENLKKAVPELIVSQPESSIYLTIDGKNLPGGKFDMSDFIMFSAEHGNINNWTIALSMLDDFYPNVAREENPGVPQARVAFVKEPEVMAMIPETLPELLNQYFDYLKVA